MKKLFFCLLGGAMMLNSCTDDSGIFVPDGIKEPTLPVETKPNEVVNGDVFSKLNLDYPGLEKVKQHYEAGEHYLAAKELLEYYRNRANILNPNVDLINPTASTVEINKANQALEYKFCVSSYVKDNKGNSDASDDEYYSFKKDDGTINWGYRPDNITSYEFNYQQHRHQWMEPQAKAYAATKNEDYVKNWIDVYSSWMAAYPCPNKKYDNPNISQLEEGYEWKGLQPAERLLGQLNIIYYYLSSPNFTPEWLSTVLNAMAETVEMINLNPNDTDNIYLTQGQAMATAAILMPEFKNSEQWLAEGLKRLDVEKQFLADGVHCELDLHYHIGVVSNCLAVYEVAKANGKVGSLPSDYVSKLKNSMDFVKDMIYPDYTVDNFNDTRSASWSRSVLIRNLKKYSQLFPEDNEMKWMAWEGSKGGIQPRWTSKMYKNGGYYMFRSKEWSIKKDSEKGIMMVLKNNLMKETGWHCQPDNGTFSLWYNKTNFLPDAGCRIYSSVTSELRTKYRRSTMHNTMSINNTDIKESQRLGRFVTSKSASDYEVIVTENTPYVAGTKVGKESDIVTIGGNINHRRAVFFVNNEFFAVVDEVYSDAVETGAPTVNLNYHLYSEGKEPTINDEEHTVTTNLTNNNLLIKAFSEQSSGGTLTVKKSDEEDIKVSNKENEEIGNVRDWVTINETMPTGKAVRMITILYPMSGAATTKNIEANFTDSTDEIIGEIRKGVSVQVKIGDKTYNLSY